MANVTVQYPQTAGLLSRVFAVFDGIKTRAAQYRVFRSSLAEMQALSDRELADLGLSRSMIRRAAYEAAYS